MRDLILLTSADSRRIEAAEEYGALRSAQAVKAAQPGSAAAWEEFGGGHLVFVAKDHPVGRAHGLGFSGKVTTEDIEHVEEFYFRHSTAAQVDVSPYADPSLFEALNRRGFQVAEFNQTLARRISPEERFAARVEGIEIRAVRPEEADTWRKVLAQVFFGEHAAQWEDLFTSWAENNPMALAAFSDGKMIAGAGGLLIPHYNLAAFFGAATLPEAQGRGVQSAFMLARLKVAQQAGCDLAVTLTLPGTTSQRNAERAGFRTAYTKVVVSKAPP
ncbi:MAG: hypothetical protein DMG65_26490 [Candidatus Angelobacter sp. Gp1-AA117]|nr:MAG: hypothetical protein DMG65_26490 [Candidatus Angelobacter sp. Gp1-AA117]